MKLTRMLAVGIAVAGSLGTAPTQASETISYTYDARGRLVKVVHSAASTVNTNNQACYLYDKADNRTKVTVTRGPDTPPACPAG